jgi:adenylate cyclase 3
MEQISRRLFLLREESYMQTAKVEDLRAKNEALVYNILPVHVAKDFVGGKRDDMVME